MRSLRSWSLPSLLWLASWLIGGASGCATPPLEVATNDGDSRSTTTDLGGAPLDQSMAIARPDDLAVPMGACPAAGNFCGGHGLPGDGNTLYLCPFANMQPGSSTPCASGCVPSNTSGADECKVMMPMPNQPVCPGPGAFCGSDGVTGGDGNTLYQCPGAGLAPSSATACASGCDVQPAGVPDFCKSGGPLCPGPGDYCGSDGVTGGDVNTLYHCPAKNQAPSSATPCANGCDVKPAGTPDVCKAGLSCPGPGAYCGADGVQGGDAQTLYQCPGAGMPPTSAMRCGSGCSIQPQGVPDFCTANMACPSAGDYCGNDGLGGPANVLYHCNGKGQQPASSTVCGSGCVVQAQGVNDYCGGGACGPLGQSALNWEANQLNTGHSWSQLCLGFVNNAFAKAGNSPAYLHLASANDSLVAARNTGRFVNWNGSCPCGAILYWSANNCNGEWGHVVICNGDGTVSTSGWPRFGGATHAGIAWLDGQECGHTPAGYILP